MTAPPAEPNSSGESSSGASPAPSGRRFYALVTLVVVGALVWIGWAWRSQQPPARFERALAALDRNDLTGVRRELNGWPSSASHEPHRHFLIGALLFREGKPVPALDELQRATETPELRSRALTMAGGALYQLGRHADAIGLFQQVLELNSKSVDAHRWLGSCFYDLGLNHGALTHLTAAAELAPQDARPHRLIGLMHKDFEHYPEAIAAYEESLRRSEQQPDVDEIRLELAECFVKRRQYDDAREQLEKCQKSPTRAILEAECLRSSDEPSSAMPLIEEALRQDPRNLKALTLKGTAFLEDGNAAAAVEWLGKAVEEHPHDYPARFKYAQALQRAGKPDEAAEQSRRANETKQLYEKFSAQHETADKEPANVAIRYELGLTALELGRPDLAHNWFRMTLALDPDNAAARQALQQLMDAPTRRTVAPPSPEKR